MIHKYMNISDVIEAYPAAADVFKEHGMFCIECITAMYESIEEGALAHGIDADELVEAMNQRVGQTAE